MMRKIIIYLISVFLIYCSVLQADDTLFLIRGKVTSQNGEPLGYVNVFFTDDLCGSVTNEAGEFAIKTELTGNRQLVASFIGYEKMDLKIKVQPEMAPIKIVLRETAIEMQKIAVTAGSFSISEEEGQTLQAMDVVTTAGAAADIMRAVQTFAGVTTVDDGAGLFVRGGDVLETRVSLDGGILAHPYKYESLTGGYFGTFSPFLLSGTFFASGGFSAQYGNALSGVLAMESLGMPQKAEFNLGLGLAATSFAADLPLQGDRLGIRFSGNKSSTKAMFRLNGQADQFSEPPVSDDANLSLHYRYSKNGILKGFAFLARERIGVETQTPNWRGFYTGDESNQLYLLNWRHTFGAKFLLKSTLAGNWFTNDQQVAVMDLESRDRLASFRLDAEYSPRKNWALIAGVTHQQKQAKFSGVVPYDPNDVEGDGNLLEFGQTTTADLTGAFVESQLHLANRWLLITGLRSDYQHQTENLSIDPRFSMVFQINPENSLKFAGGVFHQFPELYYYDSENGNPELTPMRAIHAILGWELNREIAQIRVETYYKWYENLILEDEANHYSNEGEGFARGVDFFIKKDAGFLTGWATYSFLQAKRKEKLYHQIVPTDFDITHQFKLAAKMSFLQIWSLSSTYRYSTGRPYHLGRDRWNEARGPAYQTLDLSLSRIYSFFRDNFTVVYLSLSNVLGRENIVRYTYSYDYDEVYQQKSFNTRAVYFGMSFTF